MFILMKDNYGPFKKNCSYRAIKEGRDWVECKSNGKVYFIPKSFTYPNPIDSLIEDNS